MFNPIAPALGAIVREPVPRLPAAIPACWAAIAEAATPDSGETIGGGGGGGAGGGAAGDGILGVHILHLR